MTATELFEELRRRGVQLIAEGTRLSYRAPKGSLTVALRRALEQHRGEIVSLLRESAEANLPQDEQCIHALVERQVREREEAVALVSDGEHWSYWELNRRANLIAHHLRSLGAGAETLVAVALPRSPEMVISLLGILKTGAAYVPLEPSHPVDRLRFVLEDTGASLIVTRGAFLDSIPETGARVVCLGRDAKAIAEACPANPDIEVTGASLAYVMYTSGSTGRPKGVAVTHRGVVRLFFGSDYVELDERQTFLHLSSPAFDASTFEIWGPLVSGARAVVLEERIPSLAELSRAVAQHRVTVLWLTASLFNAVIDEDPGILKGVRQLLVGGEALSTSHVRRALRALDSIRLVNGYGPTESTTFACCYPIPRELPDGIPSIPIGRPIGGTQVLLLDDDLHPVALRAPGELCIGGDGLARGYFRRPDLTAERFIPNPAGTNAGERIYRTGDMARWLPEGQLEFLGRGDYQIKIRGFRVELTEVERVLAEHPGVRAAAVTSMEIGADRRLVAYVVTEPSYQTSVERTGAARSAWVDEWRKLYDETYREATPGLDSDFTGWNSSYTGEAIPVEEMREWQEKTIASIWAREPKRVLEIGCGTGLLLLRLAPYCERYWGTDFSNEVLTRLEQEAARRKLSAVRLFLQEADDWRHLQDERFDAVILNSVVQYFPSLNYLLDVITGAVARVASGGFVFIGDVRSLPLLTALHSSIEVHRASQSASRAHLRERVRHRIELERELSIDPVFFAALKDRLPRIRSADIRLKRGLFHNELTGFRYEVLLEIADPDAAGPVTSAGAQPMRLDWKGEGLTLDRLRRRIEKDRPSGVLVTGVPNLRVARAVAAREMLAKASGPAIANELGKKLSELSGGVDPEELSRIGEDFSYAVHLGWSPEVTDGSFDAEFYPPGAAPRYPNSFEAYSTGVGDKSLDELANTPMRGVLAENLVPALREFLRRRLPDYMVPSTFVLLDRLPHTAGGKIDRKALPVPSGHRPRFDEAYVPPRTPMEVELALIWAEILGLDRVGVRDDFFELGGHSLLATQVISRVRQRFHVELPLRELFDETTIEGLARAVDRAGRGTSGPPMAAVARDRPLPLSFAQQRLWFLDQLVPLNAFYNVPCAVRLKGNLNAWALERTLKEIVRRHEVLRTTFQTVEGGPVQVVRAAQSSLLRVPLVDLRSLGAAAREREARRLAGVEALTPFDLGNGLPLRATLVRMGESDHAVLMTMHHIVSDGWSLGVMVGEMTALYGAYISGQPSPLKELSIQYADYASWQRQWLTGEVLEEQLRYWRERLEGAPVLELPTDRPRPAIQTFRGRSYTFELGSELRGKLERLSQREGVTLFMLLLAAFQALLSRMSGQKDVAVGSPIANRTRPEIEGLIGFFVNSLVLRTDLSGEPSFEELLGRVREGCLGAYAHQDLPFEKLVEELSPERDLSREPLFQVMFALQNAPMPTVEIPGGLSLAPLDVDYGGSKFDLTLHCWEIGEGLFGLVEYGSDLFDRPTIVRWMGHWEEMLRAIVANPRTAIDELPLLKRTERHQILAEWNRTETSGAGKRSTAALFESQAERRPDSIAVVFEDLALSYHALDVLANDLAARLKSFGVGPETSVALCLSRSLELTIAVLATLKAGGAYVPIDAALPKERIAYVVRDSGAPILITESSLLALLPESGGDLRVLRIDGAIPAPPFRGPAPPPVDGASEDSLCYIIYTSGSTGKPKGIGLSHRALVNLIEWHGESFPGEARTLQYSPLSFDASFHELFATWHTGGCLFLVAESSRRDLGALSTFLAERAIEKAILPVVVLQRLAETEMGTEMRSVLRSVITTGEQLQVTIPVVEFFKRLPGCQLHDHYGPSETHVVTSETLSGSPSGWPALPHIGRPIDNTQIYVLDQRFAPVPPGVTGELFVAGASLARGYVGRADLTADKFLPNPFATRAGERFYRTGDLARWSSDGRLGFLGRRDFQVKIRGHRVELGEVESALLEHRAVRQAVAVTEERGATGRRLVAYVVLQPDRNESMSELRRYLQSKVPDYMVPWVIVRLDDLPLTVNGKIDRRALPAPEERGGLQAEYAPPRTPVERELASLWSSLLGIARVGIHDNFFELGGHSLLATQLVSRLRSQLKVHLPLRELFRTPTIAELSETIRGLGSAPPDSPIVRISRNDVLPLSFAQERLWILDRLVPSNPLYNLPSGVRLKGPLNLAALRRAFGEVVRRHEALRTTFAIDGGRPVQRIHRPKALRVPLVDLAAIPVEEREDALRALGDLVGGTEFDLTAGPLLRLVFAKLSKHDHAVLMTMHHIVSDGWSLGVMVGEMTALYGAYISGQPSPLKELSIQYADYASWQRQWLTGEVLEEQLRYWRERLEGAPVLELPTDRPRPAIQTFRGRSYTFELGSELRGKLERLSQREGVTLFMLLLAAFQALLSRMSGQKDVAVGSPIANRTRPEIEGLIGFFVNSLVLRTDLSGEPSFEELLGRVREGCLGAYAHQDLPFEKLVEELSPERDLSREPLFQVMFALQNAPMPAVEIPGGLSLGPLELQQETSKFDLTISLSEPRDRWIGLVEFNRDLFDLTTIVRIVRQLEILLEGVSADARARLPELPLLSESERSQMVYEWNDTTSDYPNGVLLHQWIEAQVARAPEAIALVDGESQLTYSALNRSSNRLAHRLRALGVGADDYVGVCLERSAGLVISLLGVLKSDGAYVALDPSYPAERLAFMMDDARMPVLLTEELLKTQLPSESARIVETLERLTRDGEPGSGESEENLPSKACPENLAYMIYTSGSTGRPKGVANTHRGIGNRLFWMQQAYGIGAGDSVLQKTPFSFDVSVWEFFWPLMAGARLVMARPGGHGDRDYLAEIIATERITTMHFVPSMLEVFLDAQHLSNGHFPERVISSGEALSAELQHRFHQKLPRATLSNLYGPTECAVDVTSWPCSSSSGRSAVPIGRPIANVRIHILDDNSALVPVGVTGELCIGGLALARCYHQRPELTAEKFVPDPVGDEAGARLYRTSDLARWHADGAIEYLGRTDYQIKIRGFRVELAEIEAALKEHPSVRQAVVVAREDAPGRKRLIGYVTPASEDAEDSALREFLRRKLPAHMVPSTIVTLQRMPLTSSGKLDRAALPRPERDRAASRAYVAPRNATEEILVRVWRQALGVEEIGVEDNFFELGGDSLLSIQVAALATEAQVPIAPRHLFQYPTIADLSAVAGTVYSVKAEQEPVTGIVPLTPIQRWFFERGGPDFHHFNQAFLLEVRRRLDPRHLRLALYQLLRHHDSLRMRFRETDSGWEQRNHNLEAVLAQNVFAEIDVAALSVEERARAIEQAAGCLQASLDLGRGPLIRAALFETGTESQRLFIAVHHLVVDGFSWRILVEDLLTGYEQVSRGREPSLPPKTTSFKSWSERLVKHARSRGVLEQAPYWRRWSGREFPLLPIDYPGGMNDVASADTVVIRLDQEETRELLQQAPAVYRTQVNDLLLTALSQTFASWVGEPIAVIDLEAHGREELFEDIDLGRTVGWFTSLIPLSIDLAGLDEPGEALKSVKEQLRAIPEKGIGYGLLRYLGEDLNPAGTSSRPSAQILFNYLGQMDRLLPDGAPVSLAPESPGMNESLRRRRSHLLEINGAVVGGHLQFAWTYSRSLHRRSTIVGVSSRFLASLRSLLAHCLSPNAGGCTPSDFPMARLDQKALDAIVGRDREIEDLYPACSLQSGLLFHSVFAPESRMYFQQLLCTLEGDLEAALFRRAWQRVVDRHPVFRTAFCWEGLSEPLQTVYRHASLPFEERDWREVAPEELEGKIQAFLRDDRERGVELTRPPLMRLTLIQVGGRTWRVVWSHHHLILDGWSLPLVLKEVLILYEGFLGEREIPLEPARPYKDYIAWLARQDFSEVEPFWRAQLRGFKQATPLGIDIPAGGASGRDDDAEVLSELTEEGTAAIERMAREHHLTLNTIFLGVWLLLLSRYSGHRDVVCGSTVSGRSAPLAGIESMVGLFINMLPARADVDPGQPVVPWLVQLQDKHAELRQYEHTPLNLVQRWSDLPPAQALFESILTFENYPVDRALGRGLGRFAIGDVRHLERTNYPLVVMVAVSARASIRIRYHERRFEAAAIERLHRDFRTVLDALAARPEVELRELMSLVEPAQGGTMGTMEQPPRPRPGASPRFRRMKPKAVSLTQELVETAALEPGSKLPLVLLAQSADLGLAEWAEAHLAEVEARLLEHGALLFRGFGLGSVPQFERFAGVIAGELYGDYGDLPREEISGKVYGATVYPEDMAILFHNEGSHTKAWPLKILFYCQEAAPVGGETNLVDCRDIHESLDPVLREKFRAHGLVYARCFNPGLDVSWQEYFRTTRREDVEKRCRENGIQWEWIGEDGLRTRQWRPAIARHPGTGVSVFFNQIQLHHPSCLDVGLRESISSILDEENWPRNVFYGDGSRIEDEVVQELSTLYARRAVSVVWKPGDVLLVDNMLTAHGRSPYRGRRKIAVAMGQMQSDGVLR